MKLAFEQALHARIVNRARMVEGISVHLFDLDEAVFQADQGLTGSIRAALVIEAQRVARAPPSRWYPALPGRSTVKP